MPPLAFTYSVSPTHGPLHVRETITITSTQNTDGTVQVEEVEKKPVRIIPGPASVVQLAKIRKQSDIHEGGDDFVLLTQEYMKQVVEDVGDDEDFNSGPWVGATEYVKANGGISCSSNALGDLKVTVKDLSDTLAGSIHYKDLYKFDEEALDLVLKEEARESRAHEEWLEKSEGGGALGALGANKAITHPVIAIFLYPLRAVKAAFALEVDAMGALDLMEMEAVEALDLVEAVEALDLVEAVGALDLVELEAVGALDLMKVETVGALDLVEVEAVGALDLVEVEAVGALDLVEVGAVGSLASFS
nr:hypothetical protein [Tanacetum cinerariifolium]